MWLYQERPADFRADPAMKQRFAVVAHAYEQATDCTNASRIWTNLLICEEPAGTGG